MTIIHRLQDLLEPTEEDIAAVRAMGTGIKGMLLVRYGLGGAILCVALFFMGMFLMTLDLKFLLLFPVFLLYGSRRFFQLIRFIQAQRLGEKDVSTGGNNV